MRIFRTTDAQPVSIGARQPDIAATLTNMAVLLSAPGETDEQQLLAEDEQIATEASSTMIRGSIESAS